MPQRVQMIQRNRTRFVERPSGKTTNLTYVAERPERPGEITRQASDVDAFTATHFENRVVPIRSLHQFDRFDTDRPSF